MGKVKLTKAQMAVLERMVTGDEVWTITGPSPHTFWHGDLNARAPSFATLTVLWRAGAVENYEAPQSGGHKYRITPAGRAALKES